MTSENKSVENVDIEKIYGEVKYLRKSIHELYENVHKYHECTIILKQKLQNLEKLLEDDLK